MPSTPGSTQGTSFRIQKTTVPVTQDKNVVQKLFKDPNIPPHRYEQVNATFAKAKENEDFVDYAKSEASSQFPENNSANKNEEEGEDGEDDEDEDEEVDDNLRA